MAASAIYWVWAANLLLLASRSQAALSVCKGGSEHFCALDAGVIRCWGLNQWGQLGRGDDVGASVPDGSNTPHGVGNTPETAGNRLKFVQLGLPAVEIACGGYSTCAILQDGSVQCWGFNGEGQLGLGSAVEMVGGKKGPSLAQLPAINLGKDEKAVSVAMGSNHTCVLLASGRLKCFGANGSGQLGHDRNYTSWGTRPEHMGDNLPAVNFTGRQVKAVDAGGKFTCAILDDDGVRCWGSNLVGQLGFNDKKAGVTYQNNDDARYSYGDQPGDMAALKAIPLGTPVVPVMQVAVGAVHVCAVLSDNTVKCWGSNYYGQLGFQTMTSFYPPPAPGSSLSGTYIPANDAWGDNAGEMSRTPVISLGTDVGTVVKVVAGGTTTCAFFAPSGNVKCWGRNYEGVLGIGVYATTVFSDTFGWSDETTIRIGDNSQEMGNALAPIDLGSKGYMVVGMAITTSLPMDGDEGRYDWWRYLDAKCAVLHINYIKCWGKDFRSGLLLRGNGSEEERGIVGSDPEQMGDALPFAELYSTLPPMPPSPSPPNPPPSPPTPNPPYPNVDLSRSVELSFASLPASITDALSPKITVMFVDQGVIQGPQQPLQASLNTPALTFDTGSEDVKDNPYLLAAVIMGSILGGVLLLGVVAALVYACLVQPAAQRKEEALLRAEQDAAQHAYPPGCHPYYPQPFDNAPPSPPRGTAVGNPLYGARAGLGPLAEGCESPRASWWTSRPRDQHSSWLPSWQAPSSSLPTHTPQGLHSRLVMPRDTSLDPAQQVLAQHQWVEARLGSRSTAASGRMTTQPGAVVEGSEHLSPTPLSPSAFETAKGEQLAATGTSYAQLQQQQQLANAKSEQLSATGSSWEQLAMQQQQQQQLANAKSEQLAATGTSWEALERQHQMGGVVGRDGMLPEGEAIDPPPGGRFGRIRTMLQTVPPAWVVSTVNPKLNIFEGAAPLLALVTGLLTVMAVLTVLFVMVTQCASVCATTPAFQVDPTNELIQCVAMRASDALPPYDGVDAGASLHSSILLGKCSVLHLQQCAQSEWNTLSFCLAALNVYASVNTTASSAPSWNAIVDSFNIQSDVSGRCVAATTIASGAACGSGSAITDVCWVLSVSTINPDFTSTTCKDSLTRSRCSQVSYRSVIYQRRDTTTASKFMCSPGSNVKQGTLDTAFSFTDPTLCAGDRYFSDEGIRCLEARHTLCQEVDGGGAGICLRFDSTDVENTAAEPGILFGPGVLASSYPDLGFTRDVSGHCSPWPLLPSHTSQVLTRGLLTVMAQAMQRSLDKRKPFLQSGTLDVTATTSVANVMFDRTSEWIMRHPVDLGGGPLTAYFTNANLYCCQDICPSWLNAIGSALGFAVYLEMAMMFLVIIIYLVVGKQHRNINISLQQIVSDIVINQEAPPSEMINSRNSRAQSAAPSTLSSRNSRMQLQGARSASRPLQTPPSNNSLRVRRGAGDIEDVGNNSALVLKLSQAGSGVVDSPEPQQGKAGQAPRTVYVRAGSTTPTGGPGSPGSQPLVYASEAVTAPVSTVTSPGQGLSTPQA